MKRSLFLIFNHTLTEEQEQDAKRSLGVSRIVDMPSEIKSIWSNIPPDSPAIKNHIKPVIAWLNNRAQEGDYALVQGDFGACYLVVRQCFENGIIPVYSTTERVVIETPMPDGTINMNHRFKHCIFRRYGE